MKLKISKSSIILGIAIVAMIAGFLLLLQLNAMESTENEEDLRFELVNGFWQTQISRGSQEYILQFRYLPSEVKEVSLEGDVDERFQNQEVYITIDPSEERNANLSQMAIAAIELSRKLTDPFYREVVAACTRNETETCSEKPIVTCENKNLSVIYLKNDPEAKVIASENCVTIQGQGEGIVKAATRALYQWLGIMG